jgi:hypothetical protein
MNKEELTTLALKQRIGDLVSEYETQMAEIRAEYTLLAEELQRVNELYDQLVMDTTPVVPDE